jgi:hypothetical protein
VRRAPRAADALLALALAALLAPSAAWAAVLTRGPYLQRGTPSGLTLRWRTDVATDSRVRLGPSPTALVQTFAVAGLRTEHEVTVSGLTPATRYFYAVGDSAGNLAGGDANHAFKTPPLPGTRTPFRVWVLGDSGTADFRARAVRDAYLGYPGWDDTQTLLMLGDNAYNDGTDAQFQAAVFAMYPTILRRTPLWPTFGNHDAHTASSATQTGPYYDIFTLPRLAEAGGVASGTEAYYSFDVGNVHFVCLDSQGSPRHPGSAMLVWLEADLASTQQDWIVAYWHHPPYSKGSHDSDHPLETPSLQMRQSVLPVLEAHGVDLVLTGHSHSYERSRLIDQHYGLSTTLTPEMVLDDGDGSPASDGAYQKGKLGPAPNDGAVYAVAGSSGTTSGGPLNHPVMVVSLNLLGSMVLDVDGSRLAARFLDSTGVVRDTFEIEKPAPGSDACADGIDNDRDGLEDFPADPGCGSGIFVRENPQCNDGLDNDSDGRVDLADTACTLSWLNRETSGCGLGFEAVGVAALLHAAARRRRSRARRTEPAERPMSRG